MPPDRDTIARNLRDARENSGISQQTAADHLGLSRTLIAQIELGNRPVSADELTKLAGLYGQAVVDLVGADFPSGDELLLVLFDLAPELLARTARRRLDDVLTLCREAMALERSLGRTPQSEPPHYALSAPRTAADAIAQGEQVAGQERQRLGLGSVPLGSVSDLISSQAVRTSLVDLPDDLSGVFLRHESVGTAILINLRHANTRRRYAYAHEYAHALFDRERSVVVTKRGNATKLMERRANAFASAFLLPATGVGEVLAAIGKGQPSRRAHIVFDVATEEAIRAEVRSAPGSQTITFQDVAAISRRFGTSYQAVVYRLLTLTVLSESDAKALLSQRSRAAAKQSAALFHADLEDRTGRGPDGALELKEEIVHLAIDGYRRQVIDKLALAGIAAKLQLPQLSAAKLLELAEAAR